METKAMSNRSLGKSLFAFAALFVLAYHMISTVVLIQGPLQHQIIHLGMVFFLVFVNILMTHKKRLFRLGAVFAAMHWVSIAL